MDQPTFVVWGSVDTAAALHVRILRGIRVGLLVAVGLTAFALFIAAIALVLSQELPESLLSGLIIVYVAGGFLCGALYGALSPLLRSLPGTFVTLFVLWAGLFAIFLVTGDIAQGEPLSISLRPVFGLTSVAAALALVFTPIVWGQARGRSWAWPLFVTIGLLGLAGRNTLLYRAQNPDASIWGALLRQWPIMIGLAAYVAIGAFRAHSRKGAG